MKTIEITDAPAAIGSYLQAKIFKDLLFISGQTQINTKTAM